MSDFDVFWGEPISVYSRQMAIGDGNLIELNTVTRDIVDQLFPGVSVAVSESVWSDIEKSISNPKYGNDINGVVWDILWMAREPLFSAIKQNEIQAIYQVIITGIGRRTLQNYKVIAGICDDGIRPALTIMYPQED